MLAIIPARGGSRGVPRKNIRPLGEKPLITHTIEAAKKAAGVSRVIVTTDDDEIAAVARSGGAETPFMRPSHLAGDDSPARDVYLHAIDQIEGQRSPIDAFVVLLPTSPLRDAHHIDEAIALFRRTGACSVISVCQFEHPVEWALRIDDMGRAVPLIDTRANRQELPRHYRPNGAIYVFDRGFFGQSPSYYGPTTRAYVMAREDSIDIDVPLDFVVAECLLCHREGRGASGLVYG